MTTTPNFLATEAFSDSDSDPDSAFERDAAYRRLAAVVLRLDVRTLGAELRARRVGRELVPLAVPIAA